MPRTVYSRCLWRALQVAGDGRRLAAHLGVTYEQLAGWISDIEQPPQQVFLAAVDLVVSIDAVLNLGDLEAYMARPPITAPLPEPPPGAGAKG